MRRLALLVLTVAGLVLPAAAAAQGPGAPDTYSLSGPNSPASDPTPTFEFASTATDATFECRVDRGPYFSCRSPYVAGPLADGTHGFDVRATASSATDPTPLHYDYVIDTRVPETTISGPNATDTATPSFSLYADKTDVRFQCSIDGGDFVGCSSPVTLSTLGAGEHTFAARATDSVGHTDYTPAAVTWTLTVPEGSDADPVPDPEVPIFSGPGPDLGRLPGSLVAAGRCTALEGGAQAKTFAVPGVGDVRVRLRPPSGPGAPIDVSLRAPRRLKGVTYGVDGLAMRAGARAPYRLRVRPVDLMAGTDHALLLALEPPRGDARLVNLSFQTTRCEAVLSAPRNALRVDARSALSLVQFFLPARVLRGARLEVRTLRRGTVRYRVGSGQPPRGIIVRLGADGLVISGLPEDTGTVTLTPKRALPRRPVRVAAVAGGTQRRLRVRPR